jgi:hypothetical protein
VKGFIGPLGDDFPSIFPIVAGVVLFFGTLAYANGVIHEKDDYLEVRKAALGLSYLVTRTGSVDFGMLETPGTGACDKELDAYAKSRGVKYQVIVKKACNGLEFSETPEELFGLKGDELYVSCGSAGEAEEESVAREALESNPVIMNFPVAAGCPAYDSDTKGLGSLTVVVWR